MALLKNLKKHLAFIGVIVVPKQNLSEFSQNFQLTFNRIQILCVTFLYGTYMTTLICTLIFKENEFAALSAALTYCIIGVVHSSFYYISIWKRSRFLAFMDDLEDTIEKSWLKKNSQNIFHQIFQHNRVSYRK